MGGGGVGVVGQVGRRQDFHKWPWLFFSEERRRLEASGGPRLCSEISVHVQSGRSPAVTAARRREGLPVNPAAGGPTCLINRDLHPAGLSSHSLSARTRWPTLGSNPISHFRLKHRTLETVRGSLSPTLIKISSQKTCD